MCHCRTLLVMLDTFSKFKNPRSFYRHEEMWQLYVKVCEDHMLDDGLKR